MSRFTKGFRIFWRTELWPVIRDEMAPRLLLILMMSSLILAFGGAFWGFWLFRAPVHHSLILVWMTRVSALMWIFLPVYVFYRHIVKLGDVEA